MNIGKESFGKNSSRFTNFSPTKIYPHMIIIDVLYVYKSLLLVFKDVLIHVRDVSHPLTDVQKRDVIKVLTGLNPSPSLVENMIEVHNKIDLV